MNCLKIGICNGRGLNYNIQLLQKYGINIELDDRCLTPTVTVNPSTRQRINIDHTNECKFTVILGKARDLVKWLASGFIDVAVGYDIHLKDEHEFRVLAEYDETFSDYKNALATVAMVCQKGKKEQLINTRYVRKVASEFPEKVLKQSRIMFNDLDVTYVSGSVEGLVINPNLDFHLACTVVQTGKTLEKNNMEVFETLYTIKPSIFIRRGRWSKPLNYLLFTHFHLPIYVDGIDGAGKTTLVNNLRSLGYTVHDRGILTELTLVTQQDWKKAELDLAIYIVLDCDPKVASRRVNERDGQLDVWAQPHRQYYFNKKFRALAAKYGVYLIDTTILTPYELVYEVTHNLDAHLLPRIDRLDEQEVANLPILVQGHSKIIRKLNDKYDLVQYKPTVHSHKQQRAGVVEGTDMARMEMFRNMIEILWANQIPHSTVYIGDKYLLVEHLDQNDIPNLEIIVKAYLTGTDKHRYYGIQECKELFDGEFRGYPKYRQPYVRFDWRNPNHHPETNRPLGDEMISEQLAKYLINTDQTKQLVLNAFLVIQDFLRYCGIEILDICFMSTKDGKKLYYEISPDCARLYKIDEDDSVDKDVWRAGGSSELVLQKWQEAGCITQKNLISYLQKNDIM